MKQKTLKKKSTRKVKGKQGLQSSGELALLKNGNMISEFVRLQQSQVSDDCSSKWNYFQESRANYRGRDLMKPSGSGKTQLQNQQWWCNLTVALDMWLHFGSSCTLIFPYLPESIKTIQFHYPAKQIQGPKLLPIFAQTQPYRYITEVLLVLLLVQQNYGSYNCTFCMENNSSMGPFT